MYDVTLSVPDFKEQQTLLFCLLIEEQVKGIGLINVAMNEKGEILVKFLPAYTNQFFNLTNRITSNFNCAISFLKND